jgi:hypothetical protein
LSFAKKNLPSKYFHIMDKLFLLFAIWAIEITTLKAETLQIMTTGDGYQYLGSPVPVNTTGNYMGVGLYGTPGGHYSIGFAKFNTNLSRLLGAPKVFLAVNLLSFSAPTFGADGMSAQPTGTTYPVEGGDFTLKVVELTSSFTGGDGVNATWATTNLFSPAAAATITFTQAGYQYVDISSTVAGWLSRGAAVKELGFIGIASTPNTWSLNLGTLDPLKNLDGDILAAATPMFLTTIPEPSIVSLLACSLPLLGWVRRRFTKS